MASLDFSRVPLGRYFCYTYNMKILFYFGIFFGVLFLITNIFAFVITLNSYKHIQEKRIDCSVIQNTLKQFVDIEEETENPEDWTTWKAK